MFLSQSPTQVLPWLRHIQGDGRQDPSVPSRRYHVKENMINESTGRVYEDIIDSDMKFPEERKKALLSRGIGSQAVNEGFEYAIVAGGPALCGEFESIDVWGAMENVKNNVSEDDIDKLE
ncbi:uncharacterized protein BT62DRAFT_936121 [Guyanagaster necrorhizus]|uniref:Uncharacterized protein n=1 Tax=Guyanagaster necrorhizus TaxID=856835 RepID=A0A9P7VKF9_9AGAR|nr:uncharacterized protein BT62DRAFT_936121 [Guyanagaster necrorhizus MCA 3950]KAG7442277.1 hypothetical protein BT62DRAFT_936121 [Guyanagaster necrorhizus MCA 3950]